MNTLELPQTLLRRIDKHSEATKRSASAFVKEVLQERLDYEEHKRAEIKAAEADVKAGRVYGKEAFQVQLKKARNARKKAA